MTMTTKEVICFGEILWDVFPEHSVIGGAPLNVALRLHALGACSAIVSKLGVDPMGVKVKEYLAEVGLPQDFIQEDTNLPTGKVSVTLDDHGSASYDIHKPVAWDAIETSDAILNAVKATPIFIFGSLAVRGGMNRDALRRMLAVANIKIFDVNLRPPHYHISMVYELMQQSDFVKLNDEELDEVCEELGCQEEVMKKQLLWLQAITKAKSICVTRGEKGAMLLHNEVFYDHDGYQVKVWDTVGAGDSFLATLVYYLFMMQTAPDVALNAACGMGALVASKQGANCTIAQEELQAFINQ